MVEQIKTKTIQQEQDVGRQYEVGPEHDIGPDHQVGMPDPYANILALQRAAGNRAVGQLLQSDVDSLGPGGNGVPPIVQDVLRSSGQPAYPATREKMEARFGQDFGQVRIHADAKAAESVQALDALAYTTGQELVLDSGRVPSGSGQADDLLAHELAHIIQANESGQHRPEQNARLSQPDSRAEREATKVAEAVQAGQTVPVILPQTAPGIIYRKEDDEETSKKSEIAEKRKRQKILDDMTREITFPDRLRDRIRSAMRAFNLAQLRHMQKAGVRFWERTGLPPAFEEIAKMAADLSTPAEYVREVRVIRISERATTGHIRHELAHAWDHSRAMRKPSGLKGRKAIVKSIKHPGAFWSASTRKRATREPAEGGKSKRTKLTVKQMYERYRKRVPRRELAFDNPSTKEGHSLKSPHEFYAEGYSVFHGPHINSQMLLRLFAPELYNLLKREALAQKLPAPDEAELDKAERAFGIGSK